MNYIQNMPDVNPVFSKTEYDVLVMYESGDIDFDYEVERAYLRLQCAFSYGPRAPEGIPQSWWDEQAVQWGAMEKYWNTGKV